MTHDKESLISLFLSKEKVLEGGGTINVTIELEKMTPQNQNNIRQEAIKTLNKVADEISLTS
ncbi:hypothetical protein [Gracilibacillus alcaliphilus]|uniref:hypothetical protein n=1 Tax=Gracilibacillus alcaliphilus TaxID=1401441 RepID=UPI001956CEEC|nr:hypothetical protein [Gracilibacillus alcaliphilus]MBM7678932.1 hypothetical protein [Gracilibacillus alcaliphilus]